MVFDDHALAVTFGKCREPLQTIRRMVRHLRRRSFAGGIDFGYKNSRGIAQTSTHL